MHKAKPLIAGKTLPDLFTTDEIKFLKKYREAWDDRNGRPGSSFKSEEKLLAASLYKRARDHGYCLVKGSDGKAVWMQMVNRVGEDRSLKPGSFESMKEIDIDGDSIREAIDRLDPALQVKARRVLAKMKKGGILKTPMAGWKQGEQMPLDSPF